MHLLLGDRFVHCDPLAEDWGLLLLFFKNFKLKKKKKKRGSYLLNIGSRKKTLLFGFFWQVFAGLLKLHFWVLILLYFTKVSKP